MQGGCSTPKSRLEEHRDTRGAVVDRTTKTRRTLQALWSKLDQFLAPFLSEGIVVAVSGGPDSRALLESLARWSHRRKGPLFIATFDHGMRVEAREEARLVYLRAKRLGFDAVYENFYCSGFLGEQELRARRYRALREICLKHNLRSICTAHHLEDNAEGFVMALFGVGGGSLGAAMAEVGNFQDLRLIRPFLSLKKDDLRRALTMLGQCDFATDSMDEGRIGQRAFIRHEIMPLLKSHQANVVERLDYFAKNQAWQRQSLAEIARGIIEWQDNGAVIQVEKSDRAVVDEALCQALKELSGEKDLRQTRPTREKIVEHFFGVSLYAQHENLGLDRPVKRIIVNHLKTKEYSLPGATIKTIGTKIAIRRV